ncbi:MAG: GDCCVxC domain-containing (seleno)protein [Bacteroidota bacterium]
MQLKSTLVCPHCGQKRDELMPVDSCVYFYKCESCKKILKPKDGDCCVFCSYGSMVCPSKQTETQR